MSTVKPIEILKRVYRSEELRSVNQSNLIKSLIIDGMEVPDFELEMKELLDVKSERLMFLANKWLDKDQFWEVIV